LPFPTHKKLSIFTISWQKWRKVSAILAMVKIAKNIRHSYHFRRGESGDNDESGENREHCITTLLNIKKAPRFNANPDLTGFIPFPQNFGRIFGRYPKNFEKFCSCLLCLKA
jgi:hypothetical protein